MPSSERASPKASPKASQGFSLSSDVWAVLLSFALALLIRIGIIKSVPW